MTPFICPASLSWPASTITILHPCHSCPSQLEAVGLGALQDLL
eukprot:CAMPEP_0202848558 /NCGR_PEP_ID=MMETSP1389-20130828/78430_1 /ASSEMBLY_ACC=CAM_ASM_000865 /TAXON_ID=302021 /ORGANISM="Rhodomonas sp., Strain CCMP768" /LENGTH=42 /DNA_ID= /DNA_START= /DNA_END= /DNA_ORIENTATION=